MALMGFNGILRYFMGLNGRDLLAAISQLKIGKSSRDLSSPNLGFFDRMRIPTYSRKWSTTIVVSHIYIYIYTYIHIHTCTEHVVYPQFYIWLPNHLLTLMHIQGLYMYIFSQIIKSATCPNVLMFRIWPWKPPVAIWFITPMNYLRETPSSPR